MPALLIDENIGNVYTVTDSGTTTAYFMQGAGKTINTGDSVSIIKAGETTILFNLMGNVLDLTDYQKKNLTTPLTIGGTTQTTVEGALGALNTTKATQAEVDDMNNVLGAKNILKNEVTTNNSWYGVSRTVNADGTITLNGTSTAWAFANFNYVQEQKSIPSGTYVISGGCENTALAVVADGSVIARQYGSGETTFAITDDMVETYARFEISTNKTFTSESSIIKPMVRLASDPDDTYVPYTPTNAKLNEEKMSYADNGVLGAKNLLPYPYFYKTDITNNGITYTINDDGSITANGTATNNSTFHLYGGGYGNLGDNFLKVGTSYKLTSGGAYTIGWQSFSDQEGTLVEQGSTNSNMILTREAKYIRFFILIGKGVTVSNRIYYPMIRLASDTDDTYQLYAMTNQQITPYVQAISNPNFLDNPWFTVNQRGVNSTTTTWTQFKYGVDRWLSFSSTKQLILTDNGVSELNGGIVTLYQILDTVNDLRAIGLYGKTLTFSIMYSNGAIDHGTAFLPLSYLRSATRQDVRFINNTDYTSFAQIENYSTKMNIVLEAKAGMTVRAVKLELGSASTLAHDTAPNYTAELLKCQSYFERNNWYDWGCIRCRDAGILHYGMTYPFLVKKRGIPTFTFNATGIAGVGNGYVYDITNGTNIPTSEVTLQSPVAYNYRMMQVKMSHSSFVVGHDYCLAVGDNVIDISAELY